MTNLQREIKEAIDGIINTYFVSTLLRRPDMVQMAKNDLITLITRIQIQERKRVLEIIGKPKKYSKKGGRYEPLIELHNEWISDLRDKLELVEK